MSSPTARTMDYLRERGWMAHVVEKHVPYQFIKQDCFGGDILCVHPASRRTLLIQATSATNHAARVKKCYANEETRTWILAKNEFEVWSWKKGEVAPRIEKLQISRFTREGE